MRLHLDLQTERHVRAGMPAVEARFTANRQFGNIAVIQGIAREQRGWTWLEQIVRDAGFAIRQIRRSAGFATAAILTLTLGIGLNTSMFSFVNALMLRPLPFPDSAQLLKLYRTTPDDQYGGFSGAEYTDLKREEKGFGRFAGYKVTGMTLNDDGRPVGWLRATADLFNVLGVSPILGRPFRTDEDIQGGHRVAVVSYDLWKSRFGGATDVVGQVVRGNGEAYEIIGVLPPEATDHRLFGQAGLFSPLNLGSGAAQADRKLHQLSIIGRRAALISATQGEVFIRAFGERLAGEFPRENANTAWRSEGLPLVTISPTGRAMLFMLLGLSGCVLAISCFNLANLLLARTMERNRDFAVRSALGASRLDLIRPLVLESAVLACAGGLCALFVANWTTNWLNSVILNGGGPAFGFPLDWRVLGFASGASTLTLLFFGLGPAVYVSRINTNDTLKCGARGATAGPGHRRLRSLLIIGQFAFALILLAGAGFFLRGADHLMRQPHGWRSDHVLRGNLQLPPNGYPDNAAITSFHRQLVEELRKLPGVDSASLSYGLPYLGLRGADYFLIEGPEPFAPGQRPLVMINGISPEYFKVTGTSLISGRGFGEADTGKSQKVAIINETMARTFFGGKNAIGQRIASAESEPRDWLEIVGIASDVTPIDAAQAPANFQLYQPAIQDPRRGFVLAVRTVGVTPESLAGPMRAAVAKIDPNLPLTDLMTADHSTELITAQMYLCQRLLSVFALLGLLLAALGVYGVMARLVIQRTSEIGIRLALGAHVKDVIQLILRSGVRVSVIGAALGLLGGLGLVRFFASIFPSMQTSGGLVLSGATALLLFVALFASWLPARRAAKVDPVAALRAD